MPGAPHEGRVPGLDLHDVALSDTAVPAHAGAVVSPELLDATGAGQEASTGILGVDPGLERVDHRRRRLRETHAPGTAPATGRLR